MLRRSARIAAATNVRDERAFWESHIYTHIPLNGYDYDNELKDFVSTTKYYLATIDNEYLAPENQVQWIIKLYEYLLRRPLMIHMYPRFKNTSLNKVNDFRVEVNKPTITPETRNKFLATTEKYVTMCKYLDCISWYNKNIAPPSKDTLRHFSHIFTKYPHGTFYNTVYDPVSKTVVKAVFRSGPYILEAPNGFTFNNITITYDDRNDRNDRDYDEINVTYKNKTHTYTLIM